MVETCWYNPTSHKEMVRGAKGELFPRLEKADHFPTLKRCLDLIPEDQTTLLDLGCGAGELGRVFGDRFFYTGIDLPDVIKNVADVVNPMGNFFSYDINLNSVTFLKAFDVVVMNAFIDVMEKPIEILKKVLDSCTGYVLIHRQTFTDKPTYVTLHPSYGGVSFQSVINRQEFAKACKHFITIADDVIYPGDEPHGSVLLKRT